jgi:hypothetical protein
LAQREGWWTYEYKHKDKVRQYHVVDGTANEIGDLYDLGQFDADFSRVCGCTGGRVRGMGMGMGGAVATSDHRVESP